MEFDGNQNYFNMITILSFWIALLNLEQNIEQSKAQDIHKANDEQQKAILSEIRKEFEEQNAILYSIEEKINQILKKLEE